MYLTGEIRPFVGVFNPILINQDMDCRATPYTLLLFFCTVVAFSQQLPAESRAADFQNSISRTTRESADHKMLAAAVQAAELVEVLDNDGPFTVFAPSDHAFAQWTGGKLISLMKPENKQKLRALLTYHIIAGELTASKMLRAMCRGAGTATFTTVQGNKLRATMDGVDIILTDSLGNRARITSADADQCNGVIHVIDNVFLPREL